MHHNYIAARAHARCKTGGREGRGEEGRELCAWLVDSAGIANTDCGRLMDLCSRDRVCDGECEERESTWG